MSDPSPFGNNQNPFAHNDRPWLIPQPDLTNFIKPKNDPRHHWQTPVPQPDLTDIIKPRPAPLGDHKRLHDMINKIPR